MKPRRRRLSLVGLLVVGLLPVVWFLTDWGVFTICLPVLSMSKIRKITYMNFAADSLSLRKLGSMIVP